ncbi:MAG TPA: bifunctional glutamate N-acetyltransferase/amino-acid acetyltransferase ArgJ [Alphaproteobacteria bacterium]
MPPISPLAPTASPTLPPIPGVRLASAACGLRYKGRTDLLLVELAPGTAAAGVFTRSLTAAAPVEWCRRVVKRGRARAIVVNSGNANAFTGLVGRKSVEHEAKAAAKLFGCAPHEVLLASTGVIGEPLPDQKIVDALPGLRSQLSETKWDEAARAIMTTDTFPKSAVRGARIGKVRVTIGGIAKGSGMIAPDMATMLGFVFTDAAIAAPALQAMLRDANMRTFNSITVDGDTSTSDTTILCATAKAGNPRIARAGDPRLKDFRKKLEEVLRELAQLVVRDGEGASKFVTLAVTGAASGDAARRIGLAIANSPLVKTAIAGEDANWGRIVMAVGKAGERANRDKLKIAIGGVQITRNGMAKPGYDETPVVAHMKGREIDIAVDVGVGRGRWTVWTCDLTHGYIDINGSYRS